MSSSRSLRIRFTAFLAERYPFALGVALDALGTVVGNEAAGESMIERARAAFPGELRRQMAGLAGSHSGESRPGVSVEQRTQEAVDELIAGCDGFLRREALRASLTAAERREILRGMVLTRATDTRLKTLFTGGEVRYGAASFQGKGFRSLGQEAIYAAVIRLRRGAQFRAGDEWRGDVIAPLIRDLGAILAMRADAADAMVRMTLSAQMAKAGPPMHGKDLHLGDFTSGILPPAAPLGTGALTMAGMALAFAREGSGRVAVTFIGEGGSSLGEWHEAINLCAARKLPAVFCIENNQMALSTPLRDQSAARVFADKAAGYGIPGVTLDGTDPDEIAAAFAWAAERARGGQGPALLEVVAMRMCGHAHHDDMLYLGRDTAGGWDYPAVAAQGYVDRDRWAFWSARDPLTLYARRLEEEQVIGAADLDDFKREAEALVEAQARVVIAAEWPAQEDAGKDVFAGESPRRHVEVLEPAYRERIAFDPPLPAVEAGPAFDHGGTSFLEAITLGLRDVLGADPRAFIFGEDVGGAYGNAFLLLRPLLEEFGDRIINAPLAEGGVLGACVGAALAGQRPIGEMQFNDFVATGFNQLVNNAAKIRYRWGGSVPMVVRMPWGGLRHAGPYHSQNTEPWFYRTPGLKVVVPSTPFDARAMIAGAVADPDPVLYYEHIALYRDPRVKQVLGEAAPPPLLPGTAALRRPGSDVAIVSYGAYVHVAMRVAERLAGDGIEASVLDLRTLAPLDRDAVLALARHCSRVLIVHEDSRTGGIGESLAAIVQEEAFESLDAPVRILGALDTPVPYAPPLEDVFLVSQDEILTAARNLVRF
ncbi:MAG: alpha-ketoacid dehydrogenase subunit alpha/beta [Vicinamibacterales bacterium]